VFNNTPFSELASVNIDLVYQETRIISLRGHNLLRLEYYDVRSDYLLPLYTLRINQQAELAEFLANQSYVKFLSEKRYFGWNRYKSQDHQSDEYTLVLLYECPITTCGSQQISLLQHKNSHHKNPHIKCCNRDVILMLLVLSRSMYYFPQEVLRKIAEYIEMPPHSHMCQLFATICHDGNALIHNFFLILKMGDRVQFSICGFPPPLKPPSPGMVD